MVDVLIKNNKNGKISVIFISLLLFIASLTVCFAQAGSEEIFKAKVIKILEEKKLLAKMVLRHYSRIFY